MATIMFIVFTEMILTHFLTFIWCHILQLEPCCPSFRASSLVQGGHKTEANPCVNTCDNNDTKKERKWLCLGLDGEVKYQLLLRSMPVKLDVNLWYLFFGLLCVVPPPKKSPCLLFFISNPLVPILLLPFIANPPSKKHRRENERQRWNISQRRRAH